MAVQQITHKRIIKYDTDNPNFKNTPKPEKVVDGNVDEEKDSDWVTSTYNNGKPNDLRNDNRIYYYNDYDSSLVGYWRFEEGSGTTVSDLSGNGNDGTLTTNNTGLPIWSDDTP